MPCNDDLLRTVLHRLEPDELPLVARAMAEFRAAVEADGRHAAAGSPSGLHTRSTIPLDPHATVRSVPPRPTATPQPKHPRETNY